MIFSPAEQAMWSPPERLSVSEWTSKYRVIVSLDAAEPGSWKHDRAPYLRGIMDALADPEVEEVFVMKAARVGGSEVGRNALCYWIDQDPGPTLIVFPNESKAKEQIENEIEPLLRKLPRLAPYVTASPRDIGQERIELRHMRIYPGWSGSPTTLADRTIRYVWLSEVDKFQPFSGREADPVSLAKTRTQTYGHRRKLYAESTPTTRNGAICRAFDAATDKRRYWVPCPRCGDFQVLAWAQVKWPHDPALSRRELAARIEADRSAWVECAICHGRIDEHDKPKIVDLGEWRCDGTPGPIRAFHLSGLLSMLGLTWSRMAAHFLRAVAAKDEGDIGPLMEFVTQRLGEPFEEQRDALAENVFESKRAKGHAPGVVPRWAGTLIATADTQRDGFWYVVRAWGRGERSRLIDRGRAGSFAELEGALRGRAYPIEGWPGEAMRVHFLAIDAGGGGDANSDTSLTDEVYRFCQRHPGWAAPLKGWGGMGRPKAPVAPSRITYIPPGGRRSPYDVTVNMVDTQYFKGVLAGLISVAAADGAEEKWEVCEDIDEEYVSHMTAERKMAIRKNGGVVETWQRIGGRANHFFDAEVYQLAAARMVKAEIVPDEAALERERQAAVAARANPRQDEAPRVATMPDGRPYYFVRNGKMPDGRPFLANRR